jgi:hypothetical protein
LAKRGFEAAVAEQLEARMAWEPGLWGCFSEKGNLDPIPNLRIVTKAARNTTNLELNHRYHQCGGTAEDENDCM